MVMAGATHVLLDPFTEMIHFIIVRDNASEMHASRGRGNTERDLDFFFFVTFSSLHRRRS